LAPLMPPIIPDYVPLHFAQGTTVKFTRSLDDFAPSDGWTYKLYLNGLTQKFSKAGVTYDPSVFLVELLSSETAGLAPGPYRYAERLVNPGPTLVLTGVEVLAGGQALYSFSSGSNLAPYVGMPAVISGFANAGNNIAAPGAVLLALTGGADGGTFTVANASAVNETAAGVAQGPAETYDIRGDELVLNIEASAADSAPGVFQTFPEKILGALELMIVARTTGASVPGDIEAYHIAGRAVTKIPLRELLQLRGTYRSIVWRQQHPGKIGKAWKVDFTVEQEFVEFPPTWQDVTGLDY
jgi:hypothetical protein